MFVFTDQFILGMIAGGFLVTLGLSIGYLVGPK